MAKSFHRCSFKNVTLLFHGNAPVEFRETTTIDGTIVFATDNPAILLYQSLRAKFASVPGAKLDVGAQDDKGRELQLPRLKVQPAEVVGVAHPIPDLRLKVISMVSELQGFLGEHGEEPKVARIPSSSDQEHMRQWMDVVLPWRAKFVGDYRLRFGDSVPRLQNEIRARTGIDDFALNASIHNANHDPNGDVKSVQTIATRLWDLALAINV